MRRLLNWFGKPVRFVGTLMVLAMPSACAFCVHDPINPQALQHTAFCAEYYKENKLTEAEARCRLAREFAPKYAEPVNILGLIEYRRGHQDLARDYFKEAIALKDDFAEAHNNIGALFMDKHELKYAIDEFKQAIEIDPGYVNARINLALCYFYNNNQKASRAEYIKCLELDPKACECRQGLGVLSANAKDFNDARLQFQKMTEICPTNAVAYYNLCRTYYDMGQCGNAIEACMQALALKTDYLEARQNLTIATECLALEDSAIKEYLEKIKENPGNPDMHFNLGVIYNEKNLLGAALNEFLNTIKLKPDYAMAYYQAARVYDAQLHAEETIHMCQQFVDVLRGDKLAEQKDWCVERVKQLQYR